MRALKQIIPICLLFSAAIATTAQALPRVETYNTHDGMTLRYVIAEPFQLLNSKDSHATWIIQDGDGNVLHPFPLLSRIGEASLLSQIYGVTVVLPEIRREALADDLPRYCDLDFLHRVDDLNALIDTLKTRAHSERSPLVLIGLSAGSEISTLTANHRNDIAAVATIGGGVVQLMTALQDASEADWTENAMNNQCLPGTYEARSGKFWQQLLYSGLKEEIAQSTYPYLALIGEKDPICRHKIHDRYVDEVRAAKPNFRYEIVPGMKHGPGLSLEAWNRIDRWLKQVNVR